MSGREAPEVRPSDRAPSRPNEGRDCRKEFARGFHLWVGALILSPFLALFAGIGAGHLGNWMTGRHDELPNVWGFTAFFLTGLAGVAVRFTRRCPACGDRIPMRDYRPKRCHCGALWNDRHQTGPWDRG